MFPRLLAIFLASALLVSGAAKKTTATARGENDDVILNVTIYLDAAAREGSSRRRSGWALHRGRR